MYYGSGTVAHTERK